MNYSLSHVRSVRLGNVKFDTVVGDVDASPKDTELHSHPYHELLVCLEGEARVILSDGELLLEPASVCILPPMCYHRTGFGDGSARAVGIRFKYYETGTDGRAFDYAEKLLGGCGSAHVFNSPAIRDALERIVNELEDPRELSGEYVGMLLGEVYLLLLRTLGDGRVRHSAHGLVEGAEDALRAVSIDEYLYTHVADPITEEDLAREMRLSKRQLSRVISRLYGTSFRQLLIDYRMRRAAELLCSGMLSVDDVAERVGYTSLSGFYSAFGAKFGTSVKRYVHQIKKEI